MAAKKVSFKWSRDELTAVYDISCYYLEHLGNNTDEKLAAVVLKRLIEKLAPKVAFPEGVNKVSLKLDEALALGLASEKVAFTELGHYEGAVMIATLNIIDRL